MAFALRKLAVFQTGYKGPTTKAEFTFPFVFAAGLPGVPGGAIGELDLYVRTGLSVSGLKDKVIEYRLESDTVPTIDRYRVTVIMVGAPEKEVRGILDRRGFHETPTARVKRMYLAYPQVVIAIPVVGILIILGALIALGAIITVAILKGTSGLGNMVQLAALGAVGVGVFVLMKDRG